MDKLEESVCRHFHYCNVTKITGRDCSHPAYETCQTNKFYERYGENYNQMGVGAVMISQKKTNGKSK